jgi:hypothetical protein
MGKHTAASSGPLVISAQVQVTRGQEKVLRLIGRTAPHSLPIRLLIDTGSRLSTIIPSVISQLNPAVGGVARIETSLASAIANLFWVRLDFPGTSLAAVPQLVVASVTLPPSLQSFHGIIGRDLLSRWDYLLYEGRAGRFTIRDRARWRWFGW